jgi:hypothetical protein
MATLNDAQLWIPKDEDVFLIVIRREDTSIPEEDWLEFIEEAEMGGAVWETALNSLEQDYEEIWKPEQEEKEQEENE